MVLTVVDSIAKDPWVCIQIGESRWEVAPESRERFSGSAGFTDLIQPLAVFRVNPTHNS